MTPLLPNEQHDKTAFRIRMGYPTECTLCDEFEEKPKNIDKIEPFYKDGKKLKLMLIGQDPTIFDEPDRVNTVLMLNEEKGRNGQLRKWLETELFGVDNVKNIEIYATNLVKCQFPQPPSKYKGGALKFLEPRFNNCKQYLFKEIENYKPDIILTFGESAHILFSRVITLTYGILKHEMKADFTGKFVKASLKGVDFEYSPCLHIKTFRVAETYGKQVVEFKQKLMEKLT